MPTEVLTRFEVEQLFRDMFAEKEKQFNEKSIPFLAGFTTGVCLMAIQYSHMVGKWDAETTQRFFGLMGREQNFDPYAVGEMFIKEELENRRKAKDAVGTRATRN